MSDNISPPNNDEEYDPLSDNISPPNDDEPYDPFFKNKTYGSNLLNRPQPENYGIQWLNSLKTLSTEDFPSSGKSLVVFRIAREWLALPSYCIQEITQSAYIHKLPHTTTSTLLGISNVQGELLITISMESFLDISPLDAPYQSMNPRYNRKFERNIVLGINKDIVVFHVDEIYGLVQIDTNSIQNAPISVSKSVRNYFVGIFPLNDIMVGLLNEILIINTLNEKYL